MGLLRKDGQKSSRLLLQYELWYGMVPTICGYSVYWYDALFACGFASHVMKSEKKSGACDNTPRERETGTLEMFHEAVARMNVLVASSFRIRPKRSHLQK